MTYQVLARKWRPRNFSEMVGQEHVLQALINALDNQRLHHAFLFTGTRGVGKTTLARILAKSINCEQGISSTPCGQCRACREIDEGRFVDLIEVDAASKTKVEDTRDLLENVQYNPTSGAFKVYLIDEVHMLSNHSFNALLKTLEEPPPHVKFLLATTDPEKLPVTILSRCMQFNLKRLSRPLIQGQLEHILAKEQIEFEPGTTALIARSADGSMRDALSLLDQAIAFCGGAITGEQTRAMLGTIDRLHIYDLLDALGDGDGDKLYQVLAALEEFAPDYQDLLNELNNLLYRIAVLQVVPDSQPDKADNQARIQALAQRLSPEDVQLFYQIGINGRRDLPLAPDPQSGLEMTLLRMLAFRPVVGAEAEPVGTPGGRQAQAPTATPRPSAPAAAPRQSTPPATAPRDTAPAADTGTPPATAVGDATPTPAPAAPLDAAAIDWQQTLARLNLGGLARELASHCSYRGHDDTHFDLYLDPQHGNLLSDKPCQRLQEALNTAYARQWKLRVQLGQAETETPAQTKAREEQQRQDQARESLQQDETLQELLDVFDARLDPDSIKPL